MNVLFVSISAIPDVGLHSISLDLMREFQKHGHAVHILCALEKNSPQPTYFAEEEGFRIVRVQIGGNKKAGIIEKGLTTLTEPGKYISAIRKFYGDVKFDLVMYPTPPITQVKTVEYVKKRDGAGSYLLLKDIFPQNAVDIGMMKTSGVQGLLYRHFRQVEKRLYRASDHIGCMSPANVRYLLDHNPEVDRKKVGVSPNSITVSDKRADGEQRRAIREKYGIPQDKRAFVYGGNLGRPQGIPFVLDCMRAASALEDACFVIVGDGSEYGKVEAFVSSPGQTQVKLIKKLPKEDYDALVGACDVGLIFLDRRFTIPNFPSRLLGYLQAHLPVLAVTDPNSDVGQVIREGGFGWWVESGDAEAFTARAREAMTADLRAMGDTGFQYLKDHYSVETQYETIMRSING